MRDARVEEVEKVSDSEGEEQEGEDSSKDLTIGVFPSHQGPTYLIIPTKPDKVRVIFGFILLV